jgi:hypothetical protein
MKFKQNLTLILKKPENYSSLNEKISAAIFGGIIEDKMGIGKTISCRTTSL